MTFTYENSHTGTIKHFEDGSQEIRLFKFEPNDVGKFIVILISLVLFTSCNLFDQKPDYILKENAEYYWKVRFNPFNEDSTIHKYHKPVEYVTTVNQKGGKRRVYYYDYNGHYISQRRCPWSHNVHVGDKVKLRHNFEYSGYDTFVEVVK